MANFLFLAPIALPTNDAEATPSPRGIMMMFTYVNHYIGVVKYFLHIRQGINDNQK